MNEVEKFIICRAQVERRWKECARIRDNNGDYGAKCKQRRNIGCVLEHRGEKR